jgi:hypothetical protein
MDAARFDALTGVLGTISTRRRIARLLGIGIAAVAATGGLVLPRPLAAGCRDEGCPCRSDRHCVDGFVCCIPGSADGWTDGLCAAPERCGCSAAGCTCYPLQRTPCDPGLTCADPGLTGPATGICSPAPGVDGGCRSWGAWCPAACWPGSPCDGCCSGFCGADGACDERICPDANCRCDPGNPFSCDSGLTCVPVQQPLGSSLPGGVCM